MNESFLIKKPPFERKNPQLIGTKEMNENSCSTQAWNPSVSVSDALEVIQAP
jgi:hypothetical protein